MMASTCLLNPVYTQGLYDDIYMLVKYRFTQELNNAKVMPAER